MFRNTIMLVILLLTMIQANAESFFGDGDAEDVGRQNTVTVLSDQLRTVINQEITEINKVSGRKVEKLLRANNNVYMLARYANALWDYRFLKVLDRNIMEFVEIDLGSYGREIASAETANDILCFTMKNGDRYQLNDSQLVRSQ